MCLELWTCCVLVSYSPARANLASIFLLSQKVILYTNKKFNRSTSHAALDFLVAICPDPINPGGGRIFFEYLGSKVNGSHPVGRRAYFTCKLDSLNSIPFITCQGNGTWSTNNICTGNIAQSLYKNGDWFCMPFQLMPSGEKFCNIYGKD